MSAPRRGRLVQEILNMSADERVWNEDIVAIGDKMVGLTLLQAKELTDYLKEKYGLEPAAGGAVMMAAPAAGAGAEAEVDTGPALVDVIIESPGQAKVQVIKAVREITGLGLQESKKLVDEAPSPVKEKVTLEEANKIKAQLEEAGAKVALK